MSSLPLPSHYAQLVYVGSRPKPNNCCCEPPPNEFDVEHTPNLKLWLTKRNLTCGFFGSLILGLAPPKPPVIMESRKMSFKEVGTFIFFSVKLQCVSSRFSHLQLTGKSLSEAFLFGEHGEIMLCTEIILNVKNNFCNTTCSPHVLSLKFSFIELVIQWTICCHIVG